jgi:hypothetical protein
MIRWKYLALGLAATALSFAILSVWDTVSILVLGRPHLAYDLQPSWLRLMPRLVSALPWLLGIGLLALRIRGWRQIQLGWYALGAFLPFAGFSLWILTESSVSNWWHQERFDAVRWRSPDDTAEIFWPTRLRMVDDLLSRGLLTGLARDSTLALLGPPDHGRSDTASTVRYYLGPERGWIRIDGEELEISFDPSGHVREAKTVRD